MDPANDTPSPESVQRKMAENAKSTWPIIGLEWQNWKPANEGVGPRARSVGIGGPKSLSLGCPKTHIKRPFSGIELSHILPFLKITIIIIIINNNIFCILYLSKSLHW